MLLRNANAEDIQVRDKVHVFRQNRASDDTIYFFSGEVSDVDSYRIRVTVDHGVYQNIAEKVGGNWVWIDDVSQVDITERTIPEKLNSFTDYCDAPEGTIVQSNKGIFYAKVRLDWVEFGLGVRLEDSVMSGKPPCKVIRWGDGPYPTDTYPELNLCDQFNFLPSGTTIYSGDKRLSCLKVGGLWFRSDDASVMDIDDDACNAGFVVTNWGAQ